MVVITGRTIPEIVGHVAAAAAGDVITESWELGAGVDSPRIARDAVRTLLGHRVPDNLLDTVVLLTSEVVTNAVIHARTGAVLTAALTPTSVMVSVSDVSRKAPVTKEGQFDWESGRGLVLVEQLSTSWGVHPHGHGGKTVWFQVARPGGTVHT